MNPQATTETCIHCGRPLLGTEQMVQFTRPVISPQGDRLKVDLQVPVVRCRECKHTQYTAGAKTIIDAAIEDALARNWAGKWREHLRQLERCRVKDVNLAIWAGMAFASFGVGCTQAIVRGEWIHLAVALISLAIGHKLKSLALRPRVSSLADMAELSLDEPRKVGGS